MNRQELLDKKLELEVRALETSALKRHPGDYRCSHSRISIKNRKCYRQAGNVRGSTAKKTGRT